VSGLRRSLDALLDGLAAERGAARGDLTDRIDGYERTVKGVESPARAVLAGDADAGLGLRETAARLGCGFVPLGEQSVAVRAAPDRTDRGPVAALSAELSGDGGLDAILDDLPGFSRNAP